MRSFDPFNKVIEALIETGPISGGRATGVATWFEVAAKLELDVRAVADLDALYDNTISRTLNRFPHVQSQIREEFKIEPPTFGEALKPLHARMAKEHVPADARQKAEWTSRLEGDGDAARRDSLLRILRECGVWLHPQGRLEQVLGIDTKGVAEARSAALVVSPLDSVAQWCAVSLDLRGDVKALLDLALERIAAAVITALGLDPEAQFTTPIGTTSESDAKLVRLVPLGGGVHRMILLQPEEFAGWWTEFARDTPLSALQAREPPAP